MGLGIHLRHRDQLSMYLIHAWIADLCLITADECQLNLFYAAISLAQYIVYCIMISVQCV